MTGLLSLLLRLLLPRLLLLLPVAPLHAAPPLSADEVLLLCNRDSEPSRQLADLYAELRHVPVEQRLDLALPTSESISRAVYDQAAATIRSVLDEAPWGERVRCIVTFYGVPLKVGPRQPKADDARLRAGVDGLLQQTLQRLREAVSSLEAQANVRRPPVTDAALEELAERYLAARNARAAQAAALAGEDRRIADRVLLDYVLRCEGRSALAPLILANASDAQKGRADAEALAQEAGDVRRRVEAARDRVEALQEYQEAMGTAVEWFGLLHAAFMLSEDVYRFETDQTHASFDSELSLVRGGAYNLYRWKDNPLRVGGASAAAAGPPVVMVARLDAPTPELAEHMLRDSIAAEASGLKGELYIDSRGLKAQDTYGEYDRDLLDLYYLAQDLPDIRAILDNRPDVFAEGTCPNAALYCGWYSVARYVPAFRFNTGAVAVHIASFEAKSLRDEGKSYWCPGLMRDGAAATLGPVDEPYLHTFPKPTLFFGSLLTGKYTLVECFYLAKPCNSWQFTLLGDPLYRPFAANPQISEERLVAFLKREAADGPAGEPGRPP